MQKDKLGLKMSIITANATSTYIHTSYTYILACKSRTWQQATQGTFHSASSLPSTELRYKVMQGRNTSVQTWVEQTAQQSRVSLPLSGTSPGDRREEGAPFLRASCSVSRTCSPSSGSNLSDERCESDPSAAPRWEKGGRGGSSYFGSGFGQTIAAYQETVKSNIRQGSLHEGKLQPQQRENKIIKDLTNQTRSQKCILYKVSVAASAKCSSIPPKFHFSMTINIYLYTYNTLS